MSKKNVFRLRFLLVFVLSLTGWITGGVLLNRHITAENNQDYLLETSKQLMRRVEKAVDYVVIAGTEFLLAGVTECNATSRSMLQQLVRDTGMVSDIHLITGSGTCSSFGEISSDLPGYATRSHWTTARNPDYRIGDIGSPNDGVFGVSWGFDSGLELVFAINADAALFDVLPNELRSFGSVHLLVADDTLASFLGTNVPDRGSAGWPSVTHSGLRYPLSVDIRIDPSILSTWRRDVRTELAFLWGLLGLLSAASIALASARRHNDDLEDVVRALTNQEIVPFFQPIVDSHTGDVVGCEALARWIQQDGEAISPARFIPLVEQHGLNDELLSVMMEQAAVSFRQLLDLRRTFYLSFNVTPDQLEKPGFAEFFVNLAAKYYLPPTQICIEITERQVISAPDIAAATTAKLAAAGFKVAIDDAGTGHNGLAAIQNLKASIIKIDKFFVDHIDDDPRSRVMVDMFVSVAARYGMTTVAEGVETEAQLSVLKTAGIDLIQGFLYSEPVCATDFLKALDTVWERFSNIAKSSAQTGVETDAIDAWTKDSLRPDTVDETERLAALYQYSILDTEEEEAFDRIPRIIRSALDAPMAAIAFIDEDRRWFKAVSGGARGELPRQHSFCNHTIQVSDPTVVPDTGSDPRFRDNMLVVNAPHIRAYLGVPLQTPEGHRIGSLCCVDKQPREFTEEQVQLVQDLSNLVIEQLELRKLALFDMLTSARSRRGFHAEAEAKLAECLSHQQPFSVLMIDIDHFKQINDCYGHKVGDEVLASISERIIAAIGDEHIIGRMGGEEFAIALADKDLSTARHLAEQVRLAFAKMPFQTYRGAIPITVSIGAASATARHQEISELLEQADLALYHAKGQGRNRVSSYAA